MCFLTFVKCTTASLNCSGHENRGKEIRDAHLFLQHALHKVRHLCIFVLLSNALQLLQLLKVQFLKRQGKLHGVQCISLAMWATKVCLRGCDVCKPGVTTTHSLQQQNYCQLLCCLVDKCFEQDPQQDRCCSGQQPLLPVKRRKLSGP